MAASSDTARAIKRRGLIAGAAALVAGIAAKRTSQPVGATTDTTFTATGGNNIAYFVGTGYDTGVYGQGGSFGVYGASSSGNGVYGQGYGLEAGVYGVSLIGGNAIGVKGYTGTIGIGVYGTNVNGYGVNGVCTGSGYGVYGVSQSLIGVYGSSAQGTGVYGQTTASNQYGVLGTTYAPNSTAIAGTCSQNGSSAFSGGTSNPNAFAAFFQGTTVVQGNFAVTGTKSAALAHPDGSHRLVYCVESPESWLEDVGEAPLVGGAGDVKFDADFAALVHTDHYHVFLTEYAEGSNGLTVTARRADGFSAHERNKGTSSGTFSWRVLVKRGDVKGERLGKFTLPNLPLPDPSKLPVPKVRTPDSSEITLPAAPHATPPPPIVPPKKA